MAQIQDRKRNFYSHKQSVREESLAPQYLESAGDVLVKKLAKKQTETCITLEEQLKLRQDFEVGFELNPDRRKGISSLEEIKKHLTREENEKGKKFKGEIEETVDLDKLRESTGLSRHELELSLCEKPNSEISKLYKFALRNKKKIKIESLEHHLPDHPINHLAEIEEKYFGHLKSGKNQFPKKDATVKESIESEERSVKRKKKRRKRKKKGNLLTSRAENSFKSDVKPDDDDGDDDGHDDGDSTAREKVNISENPCNRPSLWDVKDMKKWCQIKKEYGCKPRTFYKVENGKIVKLDEFNADEGLT